jgi:ABC-type siderophore export system fused ATPase/permease subunit
MYEKLREDIKSFWVSCVLYIKEVICIILTCRSIFLTSMLSDKLVVVVFNWILLCTKEKHVLTEMSKTINHSTVRSFRIAQAPSSNIHAG